jgi:hypothetical protein
MTVWCEQIMQCMTRPTRSNILCLIKFTKMAADTYWTHFPPCMFHVMVLVHMFLCKKSIGMKAMRVFFLFQQLMCFESVSSTWLESCLGLGSVQSYLSV